ncbi:MAG TPA: sensor domain-containing diguanylate cyclase [Solirubrobacteraceae bacterium]|nr:sensor domain-containing diguanylate cyclase [Solirubrobacteraceae bacterium]
MPAPLTPAPPSVARRVDALSRLGALDRPGDPSLTATVRLASYVTAASAAAVHVFDEHFQHRIAAVGAPLGPHPAEDSMCRLVVDGQERIVCVDATQDPRFGYTSFIRGDAPVRFYASVPLRTVGGTVVGSLCSWDTVERHLSGEQVERLEDLADQVAMQVELKRLALELGDHATRDVLTGAVNRVVLSDRLMQALARRRRHGGEVLVGLVDVDRFKQINDRYGHDAGDEVLVAVARRMQETLRAEDTVARIGGDEFAFVAELPSADTAPVLLARLQRALDAPLTTGACAGGPLGASIGTALASADDDAGTALTRADAAMYAAKAERRAACA